MIYAIVYKEIADTENISLKSPAILSDDDLTRIRPHFSVITSGIIYVIVSVYDVNYHDISVYSMNEN